MSSPVAVKAKPKQPAEKKLPPVKRYCLCRSPDDGRFMVGCDSCEGWYHPACAGLSEDKVRLRDTDTERERDRERQRKSTTVMCRVPPSGRTRHRALWVARTVPCLTQRTYTPHHRALWVARTVPHPADARHRALWVARNTAWYPPFSAKDPQRILHF
jgi:hypothetical protein